MTDMTTAAPADWGRVRRNSGYFALVLIAFTVGAGILFAVIGMFVDLGNTPGNAASIGISYGASLTAGGRYLAKNGALPVEARKRLALAYTLVQLGLSLVIVAGLVAFGLIPQGLGPAIWAIVAVVSLVIGGGGAYLIARLSLSQAAKIAERAAKKSAVSP